MKRTSRRGHFGPRPNARHSSYPTRFHCTEKRDHLSLGGLLHIDYNDAGASSYEEYFRTCLRLGLPPSAIEEAYRRMVFNVVAVNQDDHVKNLSFHMSPEGAWRLAPAYDMTFAKGTGFTSRHQMRVGDKRAGITRADLLRIGEVFAIKGAERMISRAVDIAGDWASYAKRSRVPAGVQRQIAEELRVRREELG